MINRIFVVLAFVLSSQSWVLAQESPDYRVVVTLSNFQSWNEGELNKKDFDPSLELDWKFPLTFDPDCDSLVCEEADDVFFQVETRLRQDFQGIDVDYTAIFKNDSASGNGDHGVRRGGSFSVGFERSDHHQLLYSDFASLGNFAANFFVTMILGGLTAPFQQPWFPAVPNQVHYGDGVVRFELTIASMEVRDLGGEKIEEGHRTTAGPWIELEHGFSDHVSFKVGYRYLIGNKGDDISTSSFRPQLELSFLDKRLGVVVGVERLNYHMERRPYGGEQPIPETVKFPNGYDFSETQWRFETALRFRFGRRR